MYGGKGRVYFAASDDLIHWQPLLDDKGKLQLVMEPSKNQFHSDLADPGPLAIVTKNGILVIYNGKNVAQQNDPNLPADTYAARQAQFDLNDPTRLRARAGKPLLKSERVYEITGQYVAGTVFMEGLMPLQNRWFLYYGTADSQVAVAAYSH